MQNVGATRDTQNVKRFCTDPRHNLRVLLDVHSEWIAARATKLSDLQLRHEARTAKRNHNAEFYFRTFHTLGHSILSCISFHNGAAGGFVNGNATCVQRHQTWSSLFHFSSSDLMEKLCQGIRAKERPPVVPFYKTERALTSAPAFVPTIELNEWVSRLPPVTSGKPTRG